MVSASSYKQKISFERMAFKDKLKRSVRLDINCQVDDTPECKTADDYKTHLRNLNKRLKPNGHDAIYTACIIWQSLTDLSLPLRTVVTKFKLIKQIACEDEDFWMNGYQ